MSICERQFQLGVNKLDDCADQNSFKLNVLKGTCVVFSRRRGTSEIETSNLVVSRFWLKKNTGFMVYLLMKNSFITRIKQL